MASLVSIPHFHIVVVLTFQANIIVSVFGSPVDPKVSIELIEDPEDVRSQLAPPPLRLHDDWKDWETWEASPDVVQTFPYYRMGYDLDGLPVYTFEFGKWDFRQWAHHSEEKVQELRKYLEQLVRREKKDAAINGGGGMVQFADWDGFSLSHHASPDAIKLAMKMFSALLRVDDSVSYGIFVNANFAAETFINMARPFLGPFLDKFETYGTRIQKWKPKILRKISAEQLAPKYGGSRSDWKPVPFRA